LFTLISYCAIVFSFALMFANGWFTACDGFYGASAYWLSHMKQSTITITLLKWSLLCPVSVMSLHLYCAALHLYWSLFVCYENSNVWSPNPQPEKGTIGELPTPKISKNDFNCWVQQLQIILPTPENQKYNLFTDLVTNSTLKNWWKSWASEGFWK